MLQTSAAGLPVSAAALCRNYSLTEAPNSGVPGIRSLMPVMGMNSCELSQLKVTDITLNRSTLSMTGKAEEWNRRGFQAQLNPSPQQSHQVSISPRPIRRWAFTCAGRTRSGLTLFYPGTSTKIYLSQSLLQRLLG